MKTYNSKFLAKFGLSILLATGIINTTPAQAQIVPAHGQAAQQAPARRFAIPQEGLEVVTYGIGSMLGGDHEAVGQALALSTIQGSYDQRQGIKPYIEHFARNVMFLQLFDTVQDIINNSFQFSAPITAMGGDDVFKDIATIITISILLDRYLPFKDSFVHAKDLVMKAFKEEINLIIKITTFFYKKVMAINNTKVRATVVGCAAIALCYYGGSLLGKINDLSFGSVRLCFKMWTINQLSAPHNTSRSDIQKLIAQTKKLFAQGNNQLCLRAHGIKIATYSILYFLMIHMNQFIDSASKIFTLGTK
jgi:hypothetical protein